MARTPSPQEPIVEPDRKPTRTFSAYLRDRERTLEALIARLVADGVIPVDWNT